MYLTADSPNPLTFELVGQLSAADNARRVALALARQEAVGAACQAEAVAMQAALLTEACRHLPPAMHAHDLARLLDEEHVPLCYLNDREDLSILDELMDVPITNTSSHSPPALAGPKGGVQSSNNATNTFKMRCKSKHAWGCKHQVKIVEQYLARRQKRPFACTI